LFFLPKNTRDNSEGKKFASNSQAKSKLSKKNLCAEIERGKLLLDLYQKALLLSEKELNDYFLDHAVSLTGSEIGFFHFVSDDQKSIMLTAWNGEALKNCAANYSTHYPIELAGNWVDCVRLKRPVIYNDYAKSPNQKGFPSGHVLIKRFMSIPIFEYGKVKIVFGVGNKTDPYTENDVVQLQLIANELSKIYRQRQAEYTIRESEKKYRSLFENMLDGFAFCKMVFDDQNTPIDFVYLEINDAFERITGLKRDAVVGKRVTEAIPGIEKANPELFEIYGRVALTCKEERFEVFFKPLSLWLFVSVYCPQKGYFAAVFEDITERKKAGEALSRANEELEERVRKRTEQVSRERQRLYNVLETLPAYVVLLDKDYCVPFANKVFRERFGESHGRRCYDFLFKRDSACENCETYKVLKTNGPHHWEWTGPDCRDYDIYDFPFVEADGSTLILEMGIDITERKRAEKQVRDVSLYSRSLIEASLDPLVTISVEGKITDVNQATELATGCSREELVGSDFSDYFTEPEKAKIGYKQVFTEGFVRDYPLAIRHKSGKITDVLYNAAIYINAAGKMQGVFAAARDISELKKAEEQAQEAAKKLKDSERLAAIGATAGMVGHDIRNPLQAITSDVYLAKTELASTPESEEKKNALESMQEIEKNVDYINKIVADLQDFARPLKPNAEETDIKLVIDELLKKNGVPENVRVSVNVESDATIIVADSTFINRIMFNLVNNAVQAMPKGGKLTIHTYKEANDVLITVKDTGVGIPEAIKGKLFTPMFTTKSKGQGFGLAVIKRMTEALGGTVTFESQEGKGTTFTMRLPPKK
jgi:PAS domain S-box-containing protein